VRSRRSGTCRNLPLTHWSTTSRRQERCLVENVSNQTLPFATRRAQRPLRRDRPSHDETDAPLPQRGEMFHRDSATIHFQPAEELYAHWPTPTCIISDGPYGLSGFPGDPPTPAELIEWYRPHVAAWSERSTPQTTLWFWNSELGWATVHPLLIEHGWEYRCCHVWDKGIGHIAGNSNTATLRKFPVITEVCVQYLKPARFLGGARSLSMQEWLRSEWQRSGLPLRLSNQACGVLNAATRKYLTADHLWYYPPPDAFEKLAEYANSHGRPEGRPYFSVDGSKPISADEWGRLRAKFACAAGITNVWKHPQVSGAERIGGRRERMKWKYSSLHGSQKPLKLVDIAIHASTDPADVVWEPFGGLCPAAVCARVSRRTSFSAEVIPEFYSAAVRRLARDL